MAAAAPNSSPGGCRPASGTGTPAASRGRPAAVLPGLIAGREAAGPVRARNHGAGRGEPPPAHRDRHRGRRSPSGRAAMGVHGRFLEAAAREMAAACPGQARFLLWTLGRRRDDEFGKERICPHCFQFLLPDSRRVRLRPKMKVTPQIEKILKREAKSYKLNMRQTKLLKKYRDSKSVLLITCTSCNKTTRHFGKSRYFLATNTQNSGTPTVKSSLRTPDVKTQSAKKMTPVSCSRLGSKGNTPSSLSRTHASGQVTSSGSKTPRNSKFHFSKLKRMLNLEEKEKSQKADLKTFLTLL
uniref:Chromosome 18 open reading frame 21 n=1 Tax=Anas platyrhynchos TaxID=8839 RepID=A0A8B9QUY4_ANAPL